MLKKLFNIKVLFVCLCIVFLVATVAAFSVSANDLTVQRGDVNGDGTIDVGDCIMIANHVSGTSVLSGDELARADINGDKEVNRNDAVRLARYIAKNVSTLNDDVETPVIVL